MSICYTAPVVAGPTDLWNCSNFHFLRVIGVDSGKIWNFENRFEWKYLKARPPSLLNTKHAGNYFVALQNDLIILRLKKIFSSAVILKIMKKRLS